MSDEKDKDKPVLESSSLKSAGPAISNVSDSGASIQAGVPIQTQGASLSTQTGSGGGSQVPPGRQPPSPASINKQSTWKLNEKDLQEWGAGNKGFREFLQYDQIDQSSSNQNIGAIIRSRLSEIRKIINQYNQTTSDDLQRFSRMVQESSQWEKLSDLVIIADDEELFQGFLNLLKIEQRELARKRIVTFIHSVIIDNELSWDEWYLPFKNNSDSGLTVDEIDSIIDACVNERLKKGFSVRHVVKEFRDLILARIDRSSRTLSGQKVQEIFTYASSADYKINIEDEFGAKWIIKYLCNQENIKVDWTSRIWATPLKGLRGNPNSLDLLKPAILEDWENADKLFKTGSFSLLLEQLLLDSELEEVLALKAAREETHNYQNFPERSKQTAIWNFLWRIGYKQLHLSRLKSAIVSDVETLVYYLNANPDPLITLIDTGMLEGWLRYAQNAPKYANQAEILRERIANKQSPPGHLAQQMLWRMGEKRLNLNKRVVGNIQDLVATPFTNEEIAAFSDLLHSGQFEEWLIHALQEVELSKKVANTKKKHAIKDTATWATLYLLGYEYIELDKQPVRTIEDFIKLPPRALKDIHEAISNTRLLIWLMKVHRVESEKADEIENLNRVSDSNAYQQILFCLGYHKLRLMNSDISFQDIDDVVELISYINSNPFANIKKVIQAVHDGRILRWLTQFHPDTPACKHLNTKSPLPEELLTFEVLWLSGMKAILLNDNLAIETPLQFIERMDQSINESEEESFLKLAKDGYLASWMTIAHGHTDAKNKITRALDHQRSEIPEALLQAIGASVPELRIETKEFSLKQIQEGSKHRLRVSLQSEGARGQINVVLSCEDPRIILPQSPFTISAGKKVDFDILVATREGQRLTNQEIKIKAKDILAEDIQQISVRIDTIFPWKSILIYTAIGACAGIVIFTVLRAWLEAMYYKHYRPEFGNGKSIFQLDFISILIIGIPSFLVLLGIVEIFRIRKNHRSKGPKKESWLIRFLKWAWM